MGISRKTLINEIVASGVWWLTDRTMQGMSRHYVAPVSVKAPYLQFQFISRRGSLWIPCFNPNIYGVEKFAEGLADELVRNGCLNDFYNYIHPFL